MNILGEHYNVTFALWHELSVCRQSIVRLSSATLLHLSMYSELWTFRQCFAPSAGTRTVCVKIFGKKVEGTLDDRTS